MPIHADAPALVDMKVEAEILTTGIKVVDLLAPYAKGGKIGALLLSSFWAGMLLYKRSGNHSLVLERLDVFLSWNPRFLFPFPSHLSRR